MKTIKEEVYKLAQDLLFWPSVDKYQIAEMRIRELGISALAPLLDILQRDEPEMRRGVAIALGAIGSPALDALLHYTHHGNPGIRETSIFALGVMHIGTKEASTDARVVN